jgi:oligoribonuclease NrnB/cAMP/cGMP phosphodiesterase (DHH superfamily)
MMELIGIISHWDIDGIASAAMLATAFGVSREYIKLSSTTKIYDYFKEVKKAKVSEVYIADLNPGAEIAEKIVKENKKCQMNIHWIDHHIWDEEAYGIMKQCPNVEIILSQSSECTSKLIRQTVLRGYQLPPHIEDLIRLAEDDDTYSNKYELTPKWRIILRWGDWSIRYKTLESWIDGYIWPSWAQSFYEQAQKEYSKLMEKAAETAEHSTLEEKKVIFLYPSEKIHPGDLQGYLEQKRGDKADVYVFVYHKGISLRSKTLDVSLVAKAMGGGGHKYAAGVNLKEAEDKESLKKKIASVFKKIYSKV